jgi:peptidoglycan/xylan/chitin deacetylase (PgdA/CDA1 family)
MQRNPENNVARFYRKRKRRFVISAVCLVIMISLLPAGVFNHTAGNMAKPPVIIRLDDIQDYAFKDAQLFLLDRSINDGLLLSLAVIAGEFGEDREIVEKTKLAVTAGSEVTSHGWNHENFTDFSLEEQSGLLLKSKQIIEEIFNVETTVFVPPMFKFNPDTLTAMSANGYTSISTYTQNAEPGLLSNIISLPGTVQLSDYENAAWHVKSTELLKEEISASVEKYGFAVIVTHPQEFLTDGKLDPLKTVIYEELLKEIQAKYSLTTFTRLGGCLYPR